MAGQYQGGHERVQDDGRHGTKSKCVAREDKGRPIATWRRPLGEKKVRSYGAVADWVRASTGDRTFDGSSLTSV